MTCIKKAKGMIKMKIKIMTSEALAYLKKNMDVLCEYYLKKEDPEKWIRDKIGKAAFVEVDSLEFNEIELKIDDKNPSFYDDINIKDFYLNFKKINDSFATDERVWAGLSHTIFYNYMQKRWPLSNLGDDKIKQSILNHFFFNQGKPRCYQVNTLSRLWWLGKKLYQEDEINPFYMLDYISHDLNGYAFTLFGSNWSNSPITLKLFFDAILNYEKENNVSIDRNNFNECIQYMNRLSGILIIDMCDKEFIHNKIYSFLKKKNLFDSHDAI